MLVLPFWLMVTTVMFLKDACMRGSCVNSFTDTSGSCSRMLFGLASSWRKSGRVTRILYRIVREISREGIYLCNANAGHHDQRSPRLNKITHLPIVRRQTLLKLRTHKREAAPPVPRYSDPKTHYPLPFDLALCGRSHALSWLTTVVPSYHWEKIHPWATKIIV